MARFLHRFSPHHSRKYHIIFLAFVWVFGLFCGVGLSHCAGDSFPSLMRRTALSSVSIVNLLTVSLLPFLFSAFAVYIHSYAFLAALCFIKGCLFAFVSSGIFLAFDSAGWLIRLLLMFSDLACLIPLWWFWISYFHDRRRGSYAMLIKCGMIAVLIVSLDYLYVSPLLVKLIDF